VEYSPFTLDIETSEIDLLRTARELGVAIVAYSPLGRGLLTGQYVSESFRTSFLVTHLGINRNRQTISKKTISAAAFHATRMKISPISSNSRTV
jgi:aryl-alcohol dehydrogenase-like predicted oxidoreductase